MRIGGYYERIEPLRVVLFRAIVNKLKLYRMNKREYILRAFFIGAMFGMSIVIVILETL